MNETTSDAIRFLLIGAGSLFVLRLAHVAVMRSIASARTSELSACIAEFGNGYWITDPDTLVTGGMGLGERLALGMVISVAIAVLVALIVLVVVRTLGRSTMQASVSAARVTLAIAGLWFTYAALMVPVRSVQLDPGGFTQTIRPAVLGELSLPFGAHKVTHPWEAVDRVEVRNTPASIPGHAALHDVIAVRGADHLHLVSVRPAQAADTGVALRNERLARLIRSTYLAREGTVAH